MKKIFITIILLLLFPYQVLASTTTADSYILMDTDTNRVLLYKDKDQVRLIASITKIMTCMLAIEQKRLDETVIVNDSIAKAYGSGIYIEIGEEITLRDLLYGLMLRSGNDAAMMIANYISGSEEEFVKLMNERAKQLGMKNTTFSNSSGLDTSTSGNYSSAYDMAILTSYAMKYDEYKKIVSTKKHVVKTNYKTYVWVNKNKLLDKKYVNGGKTGFTERANRTLVTTGFKNHMNFVVVTLNDSDDWSTHEELYNYAFRNYNSYKVLDKLDFKVSDDNYYKDKLYIENDLYLTLTKEEVNKISSNIKLNKIKSITDGMIVGKNYIMIDNNEITNVDIYIRKEEIKNKKNFFEKILDWVIFW